MKRVIGNTLLMTAAFGLLLSCGKPESGNSGGDDKKPDEPVVTAPSAQRNLERAIALTDAAVKNYFNEADGFAMYRYFNPYTGVHQNNEYGSVWMYTSSIEAVNAVLKALEADKAKGNTALYNAHHDRYVQLLDKLIDRLEYYSGTFSLTSFTQTRNWTVYGVNRGRSKGSADVAGVANVYDDQQWLVRELVEAWHLTGNAKYLEKAEYLTDYVLDGWDCTVKGGKERGGIPWGPGYYSKHSCSNGPMVSPLVWLSEAYQGKSDQTTWRYIDLSDGHTRKSEQMPKSDYYLMFAKKVYAFQKDNLMMKDGSRVYADNLNGPNIGANIQYETVDGENYRKPADLNDFNGPAISYNSGTMLSGAADLYRLAEDNAFLKDLQALDVDSFRYFAKSGQQKAGYYSFAIDGFNNWFNGVLLRGYVDCYPYDSAAASAIDAFQQNLDYAWDNFLNENLLPPSLLVGWNTDRSRNNVEGMFEFAFAAEYAVLSRYLNK